jgi:DNA-directed RNA polymerase specialized sigma24 family protein
MIAPAGDGGRPAGGQLAPTAEELFTDEARTAAIRADWLAFYDHEYALVVRFVMHCGASLQAAEDAVQDAFVDAWALTARADAWTAITDPRGWIRRVALRKYQRPPGKHRRPAAMPVGDVPEMTQPGQIHADLTNETLLVTAALRRLEPEPQAAMAFYLDGFTGPQIASQLGITDQKARDLLKAARRVLARELAKTRDEGLGGRSVTTNYEASRPHELSDAELTNVLAAADDDLMDYVRTGADPTVALMTIMDDRLAHPSVRKQATDAAAVIKMRSMARALASDLDSHIERGRGLADGIDRVDGRARMLLTALSGAKRIRDAHLVHNITNALYHDLVFRADGLVKDLSAANDVAIELVNCAAVYVDEIHAGTAEFAEVIVRALDGIKNLSYVLDQACTLASHLGFEIIHGGGESSIAVLLDHAQELAHAYDSLRIRAHAIVDDLHLAAVLNPDRELAWIQVDASGVDLSGALFNDLDILIGVIWTPATTWPDDVVDEVRARSEKIGPDVYQVRGNGIDLMHLANV